MKIIGEAGSDKFICIVEQREIEKFKNLYYNKMGTLRIGDVIDLAAGYDFAEDAVNVYKKTQGMIESNKKIIEAILNGISILNVEKND